jgi:NitT/TauT family transport system ATP-binding protein
LTAEIRIDLWHPRDRLDPEFRWLVDDIYARMTNRPPAEEAERRPSEGFPGTGVGMALPRVSINRLAGLMEALAGPPYNGKADLPHIATTLQMEIDDLFPVAETLQLLRFADVAEGDIRLTEPGRRFVELDVDARKRLFADHLVTYVPICALIRRVLDERPSHRAPLSRFHGELEDFMSEDFAETTLRAVISWGRYAELFAYDEKSGQFSLENPA